MATTYPNGKIPEICIIGAGFGGLTVALQLKRKLKLDSFTIFEKNSDVGGAWLLNSYPGAECDIPAFIYSWSFLHNKEWTRAFPGQEEILEYMRRAARDHDLYAHLHTNALVTSCIWSDASEKWSVTWLNNLTQVTTTTLFDFVVVGVSLLWKPYLPVEFDGFEGTKVHTGQWTKSIDLKDKVVGVVGGGLSAIQVVPTIVNDVKELHSFQRSPTWILPKPFTFTFWKPLRWIQRHFPILLKTSRKTAIFGISFGIYGLHANSWFQSIGRFGSKCYIRYAASKKPGLFKQILPKNKTMLYCPMTAINSDYIAALCKPHVTVHREGIQSSFGNTMVLENGSEIKLDVLILATGFNKQEYWGPMKIIGEGGEDIINAWTSNTPNTYFGICTKSAKNLFLIYGPHSIAAQSAVSVMECQAKYVVQMLSHLMKSDLKTFQVNEDAENTFMEMREKAIKSTVMSADNCSKGEEKIAFPKSFFAYSRGINKIVPEKYSFR